jgi:short-subunit dehydrogenase
VSGADVWLILGASSAIARAFAHAAAADGADILLAGRDRDDLETTATDLRVRFGRRAAVLSFDAADHAGHAAALAAARSFAGAGTLNLFLAFGTMPAQAAIDADPGLIAGVTETNYVGAAHVLHVAAPIFEGQRAGRIVVLSSVAGDRGRLSNYVYGAAKAALTTYLQGLRARLWRSGVAVTTVKPGPVDTAMTFGLDKLPLLVPPQTVADACLKAAKRGTEVLYVPGPWRIIMAILRHIPERIFKRLKI